MTSAVTLAQSASLGTTLSFKNRLINGDFEFWQRGTAQTFLNAGSYLADRWTCMGFQQARHQRVSVTNPVPGMMARFAIRVSSSPNSDNSSTGTRMDLSQKIENLNSYDLAGQTVTYSYWIRFSSASFASVANNQNSSFGNFNSYLQSNTANTDAPTSTDSVGTVNGTLTINNGSFPTVWTRVTGTATIPLGANNVSLRLQLQQLGSTASPGENWYEVTELQLELGSAATVFDHRPYSVDLLLCQRYFQTFPPGTISVINRYPNVGLSSGNQGPSFLLPVEMRVAPSANNPTFQWDTWSATGNFSAVLVPSTTPKSATFVYFSNLNGNNLLSAGFFGASNTTALNLGAEL